MSVTEFVNELQVLSFCNVFNPYRDFCARYDRRDAPKIRSRLLRNMLERAVATELDSLWVGRDLGHRGGRRTGLAFTDDANLQTHGERWRISVNTPTIGRQIRENTASVVWRVLNQTDRTIFLWNVFPLHPHLAGQPLTNRAHDAREREAGIGLLMELIELLKPGRLVPIGADAAKVLRAGGGEHDVFPVRHPSHGGQKQFVAGMTRLYDLT